MTERTESLEEKYNKALRQTEVARRNLKREQDRLRQVLHYQLHGDEDGGKGTSNGQH